MISNLREHLIFVDKIANETENLLMEQMSKADDITEELKNKDMFEWVGKHNNIKHRVKEIIYNEYIYF